jgi:hypothetical protein
VCVGLLAAKLLNLNLIFLRNSLVAAGEYCIPLLTCPIPQQWTDIGCPDEHGTLPGLLLPKCAR